MRMERKIWRWRVRRIRLYGDIVRYESCCDVHCDAPRGARWVGLLMVLAHSIRKGLWSKSVNDERSTKDGPVIDTYKGL